MKADKYKALIDRLGMPLHKVSEMLGVTTDTLVKRRAGRSPIDREAEIAILKITEEIKNDK